MLTGEIAECLRKLRFNSSIAEMSEKIQAENNQEYLLKLLRSEILRRESSKKDKLLKNAGFYTIKSFDDFIFDEINLPEAVTVEYLKNLEFLESKTNIVMYGNVGTGKTFLSIALGAIACRRGIEVRFFRTSALVNKLAEAKKNGT